MFAVTLYSPNPAQLAKFKYVIKLADIFMTSPPTPHFLQNKTILRSDENKTYMDTV